MPSHLDEFSAFIAETTEEKLPPPAIHASKLIIADCVAAIVGGMAEPEMQRFAKTGTTPPDDPLRPDQARVLGVDRIADKARASLINGTAGTVLEMDEGHQFARGHPGMHVFPALLAEAGNSSASGGEFLRAFIIGYDIAARTGLATSLHPTTHPHGTWGVIGGAAGLAAWRNEDRMQCRELLNIASSLSLATSRRTMLEGGTVRNAYTGIANQMAHLATSLLETGFSGEKDGIASVFGTVISSAFSPEMACEKLGERFEVTRNYFKLHACCRYNHAALDALWQLIETHDGLNDLAAIDAITVDSYNLAAELDDTEPRNVLACKFSVPFAVSTTLYHRSSGVLSFTEEARCNDAIIALARKVSIREDKSMTAQLPELRPARVTIHLRDGSILKAAVETNRGDWQDPYTDTALKQKFMALTTRLWPADQAEQIHTAIMVMEKYPVRDLFFPVSGR